MPGRTAYTALPLRPHKENSGAATEMKKALEMKKELEMENLPKRTRADEIAHDVLDNSVKKHKKEERFHATRRRKLILCALLVAAVCVLSVVVAVVVAVMVGGGAAGDDTGVLEGLATVPAAQPEDGVVYIRYNHSDPESYAHLVSEMHTTWNKYERRGRRRGDSGRDCNSTTGGCIPDTAEPFDLRTLGTMCTKAQSYGYTLGKPCVLLMLKVLPKWDPERCLFPPPPEPEPIRTNAATTISPLVPTQPTGASRNDDVNVTCVSTSNVTSISTSHYPRDGFSRDVLKQRRLTGYLDPLVMLQFSDVRYGQKASVECSVCPGYIHRKGAAPDTYRIRIRVSIVQ